MKLRASAMLLAIILLFGALAGCAKTTTSATQAESAASEPSQAVESTAAPDSEQTDAPSGQATEEVPASTAEEAVPEQPEEQAEMLPGKGERLSDDTTDIDLIIGNMTVIPANVYPISDGEEVTMATPFGTDMYAELPNGYAGCLSPQLACAITGVNLVWEEQSNEAWTERFNLMVASGDYPDLCSTRQAYSGGMDTGINEDFILPLEDYLQDYMPYYYSCLYDHGFASSILTEEGHIPGLAVYNLNPAAANLGLYWIRTDYLEQAGLPSEQQELPDTYDEWYTVLTAFKNMGIVEPLMLPSGIINSNEGLISGYGIAGAFASSQMGTSMPYYVVDDEVRFGILQPEFKEFLLMLNKWYSEGLISPDFVTKNASIKDPAFISTITNGDAGIFFEDQMDVETVAAQAKEVNPDFAMLALKDPMLEEGQTNHFASSAGAANACCWVTTGAAAQGEEHLRVVLGFADFWYTEVGSDLATWGPEGITFLYDEEGHHQLTDWGERILAKNENLTLKFNYTMNQFGCLNRESVDSNTPVLKAAIAYRTENADSLYTLPGGVKLTSEESYEHSAKYNDISTYLNEHILKFIVGAESFDEYDDFIDALYAFGIEDCIALYQTAYDRYLAKTGTLEAG